MTPSWARHRRAFENSEKLEQVIKLLFMNTLAEWVKLYGDVNPMSVIDFVD